MNRLCISCGHDNYSGSALDDLEAACGCDCHEYSEDESE